MLMKLKRRKNNKLPEIKINYNIYTFSIFFPNQSATEEDADENEKEIVDIVMKKMVSYLIFPEVIMLSGRDVAIVSINCQFASSAARAEAFLGFCFTRKTRGEKGACSCTLAGLLMAINF